MLELDIQQSWEITVVVNGEGLSFHDTACAIAFLGVCALVIDYCRWSMSNRWLINGPQNFWSSISHRSHWLVIDYID